MGGGGWGCYCLIVPEIWRKPAEDLPISRGRFHRRSLGILVPQVVPSLTFCSTGVPTKIDDCKKLVPLFEPLKSGGPRISWPLGFVECGLETPRSPCIRLPCVRFVGSVFHQLTGGIPFFWPKCLERPLKRRLSGHEGPVRDLEHDEGAEPGSAGGNTSKHGHLEVVSGYFWVLTHL